MSVQLVISTVAALAFLAIVVVGVTLHVVTYRRAKDDPVFGARRHWNIATWCSVGLALCCTLALFQAFKVDNAYMAMGLFLLSLVGLAFAAAYLIVGNLMAWFCRSRARALSAEPVASSGMLASLKYFLPCLLGYGAVLLALR